MDAMINTALLASAEKIINAALLYDPASRIALAQLAPKVLAINITEPPARIFVLPDTSGVRILGHYEGEITTQLQGTLPALISLVKSERLNLKDSGVILIGNTGLLQDLRKILNNLDIDWEEILSQIFGDIIGHQSAQLIRSKLSWTKDRAANFQRLTSEFLTEELRVLPGQSELALFNAQVDELTLNTDRLEARFIALLERAKQQSAQQE